MEVILLEKIQKLGDLGQQVNVKPGYGRNYLIPNGKAVSATAANVAKFEARREELEKAQADALGRATARAAKLSEISVSVKKKAGAEGKLFGSVGTADISEAVSAAGEELSKHEVILAEGPLRMLGEFDVAVHLHADVDVTVKVIVEAEEE
ncbi:MAG: 50S ribosomal protein L9 [Gammaproteobacteria bacterium]|nr:50S ribosomal protein L9 [Gammaproteobacteria bacterium]